MANKLRGLGAAKKELTDHFFYLAHRHNGWQVWCDFVSMFALSISNAVDLRHREAREAEYMAIAKRYSADELQRFADMAGAVVLALEENPDQDYLGSLYMQLELGNDWKGQFFTPYCVCRLMAETQGSFAEAVEQKGYITINDPCCGAGATLIAAAMKAKREDIFYHDHLLFVGQDIDHTVAMMCYIQLSLLGCAGYVIVGNSLARPPTVPLHDEGNIWYTPFYFKDVWHWRRAFAALDGLTSSRPPPAVIDTTGWKPGRSYYYFYGSDV